MSSPLSSFANARILWLAPGSRSSGREGYKLSPGQPHLIEAFIKRRTTPSQLADRYGLPYNAAPLWRQFGTTWLKNLRLAFPGGTLPPEPARA